MERDPVGLVVVVLVLGDPPAPRAEPIHRAAVAQHVGVAPDLIHRDGRHAHGRGNVLAAHDHGYGRNFSLHRHGDAVRTDVEYRAVFTDFIVVAQLFHVPVDDGFFAVE